MYIHIFKSRTILKLKIQKLYVKNTYFDFGAGLAPAAVARPVAQLVGAAAARAAAARVIVAGVVAAEAADLGVDVVEAVGAGSPAASASVVVLPAFAGE